MPRLEPTVASLRESEGLLGAVVTCAPVLLLALNHEDGFTLFEDKRSEAARPEPGGVVGRSVFGVYRAQPGITDVDRMALEGDEWTTALEVGGRCSERCAAVSPTKMAEVWNSLGRR